VTGSKYCLSVDPNIGKIIAHDSCPMALHLNNLLARRIAANIK